MGKPSAPPAPDYTGAAQATAAGNAAAAATTAAANRVNTYTPYGSAVYSSNGNDAQGNPTYNLTQSLSPSQQKLFDQNLQVNQTLGDVSQQGVGYVQQALNKPLDFAGMQSVGTPGQIHQQASDAAYQNATRYLDPQFAKSDAAQATQLANQGITQGSEAWKNAQEQQAQAKDLAYSGARNQAYLQGQSGAAQTFGQETGLRNQQIAEAQTLQNNPINMLNAVRTGSQMQTAQMPSQLNTVQQGGVAGADYLGAATAQGQYNQGMYNAASANQSGMMGGIIGAGGAIAGGMMGAPLGPAGIAGGAMMGAQAGSSLGRGFSDPRTKENIKLLGKHHNLNVYSWTYKPEFQDDDFGGYGEQVGYMANEVADLYPDAIGMRNGFMTVDYDVVRSLNG